MAEKARQKQPTPTTRGSGDKAGAVAGMIDGGETGRSSPFG